MTVGHEPSQLRAGVPLEFLTVNQAALGTGISEGRIRRACKTRKLQCDMLNGKYLVDPVLLSAWKDALPHSPQLPQADSPASPEPVRKGLDIELVFAIGLLILGVVLILMSLTIWTGVMPGSAGFWAWLVGRVSLLGALIWFLWKFVRRIASEKEGAS